MKYLVALLLAGAGCSPCLWGGVEDLVRDLALAPPELEADGLIRLVEAGQIKGKEARELLDRAYLLAVRAKRSLPMMPGAAKTRWMGESVPSFVAMSRSERLDGLTLQLRVVDAVVGTDLSRARELFEGIALPVMRVGCEDALLPDMAGYVRTAFQLAAKMRRSPVKEVREDSESWLARQLELRAESMVLAVAQQLEKYEGDREYLLGRFGASLQARTPEPRGFFSELDYTAERVMGLRDGAAVLDGFVAYVRKGLAAARCADVADKAVAEAVSKMVERARGIAVREDLKAAYVALEEVKPEKVLETTARMEMFRDWPGHMKLLTRYKDLRFGTAEQQAAREKAGVKREDRMAAFLSLEERRTPAWVEQAEHFLAALEAYEKAETPDRLGRYLELNTFYEALVAITPDGTPYLRKVLTSWVQHVGQREVSRGDPAVWAMIFRRMWKAALLDEQQSGRRLVREAIAESGDGLMNLLLRLEDVTSGAR